MRINEYINRSEKLKQLIMNINNDKNAEASNQLKEKNLDALQKLGINSFPYQELRKYIYFIHVPDG